LRVNYKIEKTLISQHLNIHMSQHGLLGSLIQFDPHAFVSQCQFIIDSLLRLLKVSLILKDTILTPKILLSHNKL